MPAVQHGERARRTVVDRRRASRDVCPPRPMRPDLPDEDHRPEARDDHHTPQGVTLDDVLSSAWEALSRHESAACLVCGGAMRPRYGSGPVPTGGRCTSCSTLVR
jgi:hypothetical protein